jgi:hypothetical protein
MHDGCSGAGNDGAMMLQKVRMMGFSGMPIPVAIPIKCGDCGETFTMTHFETPCEHCGMIHAVTPCSADDPTRIKATGTKE